MKHNNFICSHEALKHCKRTFEPCSQACRQYGECGECINYYIPAGQEPCKGCEYLFLDKPQNTRKEKKHDNRRTIGSDCAGPGRAEHTL